MAISFSNFSALSLIKVISTKHLKETIAVKNTKVTIITTKCFKISTPYRIIPNKLDV